jgi:hypothetical protein
VIRKPAASKPAAPRVATPKPPEERPAARPAPDTLISYHQPAESAPAGSAAEPDKEEKLTYQPGDSAGAKGEQAAPCGEAPPPAPTHMLLDPTEDRLDFLTFEYDDDVSDVLASVKTVNVNAHSLGIVARSPHSGREVASILIPKNSPLPTSQEKVFGTVMKNQKQVKIRVVEGESRDPGACAVIGRCVVAPLPGGLPKGSPIRVTFTYDNSGRLHVTARDDSSGVSAQTVIIRQGGLSGPGLIRARDLIANVPVS